MNPSTPKLGAEANTQKKKGSKISAWIRGFDANKLKPFLIYKYNREQHRIAKQIGELLIHQGEHLEDIFVADHDKSGGEIRKSKIENLL